MNTTVHVVPHSHWDREWYLPFEQHRARLVALVDSVLELLQNENYTSYHLDGQMIAVEDYLEIRPQNRALVERFVREGRLKVGPWYVLQDTYLTSGEANVRNLLCGLRMAEELGGACAIGYLPDAFGNAGQLPQLLSQAGMTAAVFGRGVTLVGRDQAGDPSRHFPRMSEFLWQSPDGSCIPGLYFANWYDNGREIPVDEEQARAFWAHKLAGVRKYAATGNLLLMNGCDHQPVQRDLPEALATARKLYPEIRFVQSSLDAYASDVLANLEAPLEVVPGELEDQQTEGYNTLRNTASSRCGLKALNRKNEVLLEKQAEPLAAMARLAGADCDADLFRHAWKLLMRNHPHDSICGCSIDAVHREIEARHQKSLQLGQWLLAQAEEALADRIAAEIPESGAAFAVWNSSAWPRGGRVEAVVSVQRVYGAREARPQLLNGPLPEYQLTNGGGEAIPCAVEDLGVHFGYDLPDDRFRQPYFERRARLTFEAKDIPAFGYETFRLAEGAPLAAQSSLVTGERQMQNERLRVDIREDGSFDLTDRRTGRTYAGLGVLEDVGDVGDEYIFQAALGEPILTAGVPAKVRLAEDTPFRAAFEIEHCMRVPESADDALAEAMEAMEPRRARQIGRSQRLTELRIRVTVALERAGEQLSLSLSIENTAKDHRLRMLFPTDVRGDSHFADSVFDLVRRPDVPGERWSNPSRCDRMQLFVAAAGEREGLAVTNRGLYEYEVLDGRRTLAVTLLRAVGELGDWGVFPTPEAQCPGRFDMDLAVMPLAGEGEVVEAYRCAHVFQTELRSVQIHRPGGTLPARHGFVKWQGDGLICTCLKPAEDGRGIVMRLLNAAEKETELRLTEVRGRTVWRSDILENRGERLEAGDGKVCVPVGAKKIITIRFEEE